MKYWRYELTPREGGGHTARRRLVDAHESERNVGSVPWALRVELPACTVYGTLLVLLSDMMRAVARDRNYRAIQPDGEGNPRT